MGAEETRAAGGLAGMKVVAFESRLPGEMAALIRKQGGQPLIVPAVREVPPDSSEQAVAFGERLLAGEVDGLVLLTGTGTRALLDQLSARWTRERVTEALGRITLVARGAKAAHVLAGAGLKAAATAPEPNTWRELLRTLDERWPPGGKRVAVQEYGVPNEALYDGLAERGAEVLRVPVYRWALPEDTAVLAAAVTDLAADRDDVVLFTSAVQVDHLMKVAERQGRGRALRGALRRAVVGSVGPTTTEALREYGLAPDLEPAHPRMGQLVIAAAAKARSLLEGKRAPAPVLTPRAPAAPPADPLRDSLFLRACRREPVPATPVWLMRQAGRYMKEYRLMREDVGFLDLCRDPARCAEVTVNAVERLGVDAAILFSDLLVPAEPMGFPVAYGKGEGPVIARPIRRPRDVDRLRDLDPAAAVPYVAEAVRLTRAALPPDIPLIGFAGAPFTLASYLIEGEGSRNYLHVKTLMHADPGAWSALMERLAASLARYVNAQLAAGAQAVQLFDSWVGCLSPADYRTYVLPHTRALIRAVTPGAPVIHFGTQTGALLGLMKEAGGDVIGLDWRVSLVEAWARLGGTAVMGNLDPAVLFAPPATVRAEAKRVLEEAAGRWGHVFNLGHGILPGTPVDHVRALVDAVHDLSRRP